MKTTASMCIAFVLAAVATSAFAVDNKIYKIPSPRGGYTSLGGTGPCADVYYSGEKNTPSFHVEQISNRACAPGETDGHRKYVQVNPTGPGAGGASAAGMAK
jgi:hypothetical protein